MEYPTRRGIAIPPQELCFPPSELDLGEKKNWNNHHNAWTRRAMAQNAMLQTLRDLDRMQFMLPVDTHVALHRKYDAPPLPSPKQTADVIIEAYEAGEKLKVYEPYVGYKPVPIPKNIINGILNNYGSYE